MMTGIWQSASVRWSMYVGRRLVGAALAMLGVVIIVFVLTHLLGDPARLVLGPRASEARVEEYRQAAGYDKSLVAQFGSYVGDLARGDLGISQITQQSVAQQIGQRLPATMELVLASLILGLVFTVPMGILAARRPGGPIDRASQAIAEVGLAMPNFWLGLLLILLFVAVLNWAPTPLGRLDVTALPPPKVTGLFTVDSLLAGDLATFRSSLAYLVLPAVTLALTSCPPILQLTRNGMIEALNGDAIRTARSLGLSERRVLWYAFKLTLVPVVTVVAMIFGYLVGGTVLVEAVYAWPGIGLYAVQSMQTVDYAPVLGVVLVSSAAFVLMYFVADIIALIIDPRVRDA